MWRKEYSHLPFLFVIQPNSRFGVKSFFFKIYNLKSLSTFIKILTFFYVFVVVVEAGGCCVVVFVVIVVEVAEFEFVVDFVFSFEKRYGRQPLGSGSGTKSRSRS